MERCFASEVNISTSLIAAMPGHEIHKIYPSGVGSAPSSGFVAAVVCDDFVFVAGQMAHNAEHGLDPRAHVPDHAAWAGTEIRKQTEFLILEKLKPALEAAGSSLERSLKAQVHLARVDDFPDFVDVWNRYYANIPCAVTVVPTKSFVIIEINLLDSSSGNQRQEDSKNREAWVRRPADRRSVGWLCRRGGRRLRACWPADDGGRGGDGSGCWRAGRRDVCGRTERAAQPEPPWG
jgi:enamine deaminase RidA (YjgF/YER057c/UK114 family)